MSLTADNILQSNTGSFSATSGSATLLTPTTAGSMVVLCTAILGADGSFVWELEPPTGFFQGSGSHVSGATANKPYIFIKKNTSGEDTWLLEPRKDSASGNARDVVWAVFEVAGTGLDRGGADLGTFNPAASAGQWGLVNTASTVAGTESAVASRSTGNSDATPCYDNLAFAIWAATSPNTTIPVLSAHTNGFVEVAQVSRVGATRALTLSVAIRPSLTLGALESTVSISPSSACYTAMAVLFADGAKYAPDLAVIFGAELGTATSIATGSILLSGTAPFDTVVGTPAVVTTSPRTGTYCLELSSTSAAECLTWGSVGPDVMGPLNPNTFFPYVFYVPVYFPTLPGVDVELASCEAGSLANGVTLWYRTASQKLGMTVGTGTEVLSDATVSASTWIAVDGRWDPRFTNHLVDWRVDYDSLDATAPVTQTQAVGASTSIADPTLFRLGWTTSKTATVRYDDVAVSKAWGAYPIGDTRITVVKPDPAGTPTVSGSATNFRTFTGGPAGTLTAWSAATTVTALDEIPPVAGASGDGLLQIAVAATDYVEIPMATFTAAPGNVLRAVRWYVAGCAASTASATMSIKFVDTGGVVNEIGQLAGHHGLDATTLRWLCRMHRFGAAYLGTGFYQITQARMDALKVRVGYSGDATPDLGIYAVFAEVAYQPVEPVPVFGQPGGLPRVEQDVDPNSRGIVVLRAYTDTGQTGTLTWYDAAGTPTPVAIAAASNPQTITLNAADVPSTPRLEFVID